jgi:hypothetical protein
MAEPTTGNAQVGTGDNGGQQAGNPASLTDAYAGANGTKPEAEPGNGGQAAGNGNTGSEPEVKLAPWAEQLPPELRGNPDVAKNLAKYAKVGDVVKALLDTEAKLAGGNAPGTDAKPEEVAAYWEKQGKPKTAEEYSFAKEPGALEFAAAAHGANLTAGQAEALYKRLTDLGQKQNHAAQEASQKQILEADALLKKEYGAKYPEKINLFIQGCDAAGKDVRRLLYQSGLGGNADIIKAFIAYGQANAESGATRGGGAAQPLKSVNDGGWYDYKNTGGQ